MKYIALFCAFVALLGMSSCQDLPPTAYTQETIVEAFLLVGQPVGNVRLARSLPITDTFNYERSIIDNANILVYSATDSILLAFDKNNGTYSAKDTTIFIQPNTQYFLQVSIPDFKQIITAETTTPGMTAWTAKPKTVLQYPADTINFPSPDSLKISWKGVAGVSQYLIRITCLDTMEYGKYLEQPNDEKNRRAYRLFGADGGYPQYNNLTEYGFLQSTSVRTVWNAFKWFGKQELAIYAADYNFAQWFKLRFGGSSYDPNLSNINGGIGCFGSAHEITSPIFLLKNQR